MADVYRHQDEMSLWWLGGPMGNQPAPILIGRLFLADSNRKVGLEYAPAWLKNGFELSEGLPLARGVFIPKERDMAAGAVDDARPDRWGERVIRNIFKPARLSVLEYLYFAGDDRFGALGVSLNSASYQPSGNGAMAGLDDLGDLERAVSAILSGEKLDEKLLRLVRPGPSFGGARPKSVIQMDEFQWVVKFSEGESFDTQVVEHATMRLAALCGINVAETKALPLAKGHAVAVKRFDRLGPLRAHVISAKTVLGAAGLPLGYPEMAQSMRRICRAESIRGQQEELFRRMVFNILMDNTDDHEKNHAFIRAGDGFYELSPAYDVVPSVQGLGYQQMRVGKSGGESSIENALSEAPSFGLKKDQAHAIVKKVVGVVDGWKEFFRAQGVLANDIEAMAQYIDGASLATQRAE